MSITPREFSSLTILTEPAAQAARTTHDELTKICEHPVFRAMTDTERFKSGVWVDNNGEPVSIPLAGIVQPGACLGPYGNQSDKPRSKWDEKGILSMHLKLDLGPPIGTGTSLKTAYVKAFNDSVRYVLNLQQQGLGHSSLTHESVVKHQDNVHSVVEYEDGSWILKLTANMVKRAPKAVRDTETEDDVQERMGSLFDNDESEDDLLSTAVKLLNTINYSGVLTLLSRPDRDPEGFFDCLKPSQKKALVYCDDVAYYGVDGALIKFDSIQSHVHPGDFVLVWAEMRQINYMNTKTFQLVMDSIQTFGPALHSRSLGTPATPAVLGKRVVREDKSEFPRARKRAPIVPMTCGGSNEVDMDEVA